MPFTKESASDHGRKGGKGRGKGKGKGKGRPGKGKAEETAEEAAAAAAADPRRAIARRALDARIAGSVQHVDPSAADLEALAEAEAELTVEQVALQEMRAQGRGWVCALWVQKQLRVFLAHRAGAGRGSPRYGAGRGGIVYGWR